MSESNIKPPSVKEPIMFTTEPKYKCNNVQMYHIFVTETMGRTRKTVAITDMYVVCTDIS